MTVLVTGASGFVGRAIAALLSERGMAVRPAARGTAGPLPDLSSDFDPAPLLEGVTAVVHAAGLAHQPSGTSEALLHRVNAEAAGRLARAAAGRGITRFVLISSIRAIAGPSAEGVLDETTKPAPTDAYGRSKLAGEIAVREAFPDAVILRPPVIYGPRVKANMARLLQLARLPLPLPLANLKGRRSVVSDRNFASAVAFVLRGETGTFHVDDGAPLSVPDLIAALRASLGRKPGLFAVPGTPSLLQAFAPRFADQLARDLVVTSAALRARGWQPVETSAAGLARTAQTRR